MADDLQIYIDNEQMDIIPGATPVTISYKLEDNSDFQTKEPSSALSIEVPATTKNSQLSNSFNEPSVEDLSTGEAFKNARKALIKSGSWELLKGKAFLTSAKYRHVPISYLYDFYGDLADATIDLADATLYDFLQAIELPFTQPEIMASWNFDGRDINKPYVFAPVRYGQPMDDGVENYVQLNAPVIKDWSMKPEYMKPSLSVYWILYLGFKSVGYKINSVFFDTNYFRRLVMPWTWGNFLYSEGTQTDNLNFLAKSTGAVTIDHDFTGIMDLLVSNDTYNPAYDANGSYEYDAVTKTLQWTYLPQFDYGTLEATFKLTLDYNYVSTDNGNVEARIQWFKNGQRITTNNPGENGNGDVLFQYSAPTIGGNRDAQIKDFRQAITVEPNDIITAQFYGHLNDTNFGTSHMTLNITGFGIDFFRIPLGGTIKFSNYLSFKNYKFLDFFAGIVDCFNLIPKCDSVSKVITIEPQHAYSLNNYPNQTTPGYFNGEFIDWSKKQDLSKDSVMTLFRDYNRQLRFKFKDDSADGLLKKVQDRNAVTLGAAKYVLPDRFTDNNTDTENRFFSPVMHYDVEQWKLIGYSGDAPQMVCMIPENVSNTSHDEAQNTFSPKLCWYKGQVEGYGWVFAGVKQYQYPFMFAVNYKQGGEADPVLSYSDEKLFTGPTYLLTDDGTPILDDAGRPIVADPGGYYVAGAGLLRRFYLQRMAIMRNGQYCNTFFRLKNNDIANVLHREHIVFQEQRWELTEIKNYNPVSDGSTECALRKWTPITQKDINSVYPTGENVVNGEPVNSYDTKYNQLMALNSDITVGVE